MARYVAKNVVAAGLRIVCEVQLAYAIAWPSQLAFWSKPLAQTKLIRDSSAELVRSHFASHAEGDYLNR